MNKKWLAFLTAVVFILTAHMSKSGEIDADQKLAIEEAEGEGANVMIGPSPDFAISMEVDVFAESDHIFDVLPKLHNLRSLSLLPARYPRLDKLDTGYLKRLNRCRELTSLYLECRDLKFEDLAQLYALPNLKDFSIRCRAQDSLPDIRTFLQRPEATKLESVTLAVDAMADEDCVWLAAIPNLRDIGLHSRTSRLTDDGIAQLAKKENLRSIKLRGIDLTPEGMRALSGAQELESIEVVGSSFGDDGLQMLAGLPKLKRVDVSHCRITPDGMRHFKQMTSLEELDITNCPVEFGALANLVHLTKLRRLKAAYCGLEDEDLASLEKLTNLESLDLNGNGKISHDGLVHLAKLTNLTSLKLAGVCNFPNGLNDFAPLKRLRLLHVNCDAITASDIEALSGFTALEELDLSRCNIGHGGLEHIRNLKSLRSLDLSECELDDADLASLNQLESLRILSLRSNNLLTDKGIAQLSGLKHLNELRLASTELSDEACLHLRSLTHLTTLEMRTKGYSDRSLAALAGLSEIRHLNLHGPAELNDSTLAAWRQLKKIRFLAIQTSPRSAVSARELADLFPEASVRVNGQRFNDR